MSSVIEIDKLSNLNTIFRANKINKLYSPDRPSVDQGSLGSTIEYVGSATTKDVLEAKIHCVIYPNIMKL